MIEAKSHLIIFEEKLDVTQLTERENMAYKAGVKVGNDETGKRFGVFIIIVVILTYALGIFVGYHLPHPLNLKL